MINNFPLSAISISVALLGITMNVFLTKPFIGIAKYASEKKKRIYKIKSTVATIANVFIIIGTFGQCFSVIFFY